MNTDSNMEHAKMRDKFLCKWSEVERAVDFREPKDIAESISEAMRQYTSPENGVPDFIIAEALRNLDLALS